MHGWIDQHSTVFEIGTLVFAVLSVDRVMAWYSGWTTLAKKFPAPERVNCVRRWGQSASMRWLCGYNHVLIAGANSDGLYLATIPFFGPFHRSLLVPWPEIHVAKLNTTFDGIALELGNAPRLPVTLYGRIVNDLRHILSADPANSGVKSRV
jgi:hypothetical protein